MTKLILCAVLCTSTLMTSLELYRRKVRIADTAEELSDIIGRMISLLRFESADVYTLCRECFTNGYPQFQAIIDGNFRERWMSACQIIIADTETLRLLGLVGETLGNSDTQSQIERLQAIREDLRSHARALKQKHAETKKLYTTLGALSGLAVAIIII